jgi:hypothetical protein
MVSFVRPLALASAFATAMRAASGSVYGVDGRNRSLTSFPIRRARSAFRRSSAASGVTGRVTSTSLVAPSWTAQG